MAKTEPVTHDLNIYPQVCKYGVCLCVLSVTGKL